MQEYPLKISFIVPIHNTAEFLPRCIESLLTQTLVEIEVILLDNASSDQSAQICQHYQAQDVRVHFYQLAKIGVSRTRNYGLDVAQGEFVGFVDSDDYLLDNFAFEMYLTAKQQNSALVCCGVTKVGREQGVIASYVPDVKKSGVQFFKQHANIRNPVWNKIYQRAIIEQYQIRFPAESYYVEDYAFNFMFYVALSKKATIAYVPRPLYCYWQHSNSMMSSLYQNLARLIPNLMLNLEAIIDFLHKNNYLPQQNKLFRRVMANYYISELPLWQIKQALIVGDFKQSRYAYLIKLFWVYQRKYGHYLLRLDKIVQIEHICKVKLLYKAKFRNEYK